MKSLLLTLTNCTPTAGPFDLYSNVDGFAVPFDTNVTRAQMLAGYTTTTAPDTASEIKIKSKGVCINEIKLTVDVIPTLTTTTSYTTISGILDAPTIEGTPSFNTIKTIDADTTVGNLSSFARGVGPFTFEEVGNLNPYFYLTIDGNIKSKSVVALQDLAGSGLGGTSINFKVIDSLNRENSTLNGNLKADISVFASISTLIGNPYQATITTEGRALDDYVGGILITKNSGSAIVFSILPGYNKSAFYIQKNGIIRVKDPSQFVYNTSLTEEQNKLLVLVSATNGVDTINILAPFYITRHVKLLEVTMSIAPDGRSVDYTTIGTWDDDSTFNYPDYDSIYVLREYTIKKSDAAGNDLGILVDATGTNQVAGYLGKHTTLQELIFGGAFAPGPYDQLTDFKFYVDYNYNTAYRAPYYYPSITINGVTGPPLGTAGVWVTLSHALVPTP